MYVFHKALKRCQPVWEMQCVLCYEVTAFLYAYLDEIQCSYGRIDYCCQHELAAQSHELRPIALSQSQGTLSDLKHPCCLCQQSEASVDSR